MKLVCPSCGAGHSAEGWSGDAAARQCLRIVAELPRAVSRPALAYLALFRPGTGRGLSWAKALRLMSELAELVRAQEISWERQPACKNSATAWGLAMERVAAAPPRHLPLKSHGYLRAVAYEIADELCAAEEKRAAARHRPDVPVPPPPAGIDPAAMRAVAREKLKNLK